MTALRDDAFAGLVEVAHQLAVARDQQMLDLVAIADLNTSRSDCRIALALANGLPVWCLDRDGNYRERVAG